MNQMQSRKGLRRMCGVCQSRNIEITSALDGRREWQCQCGYRWTEGKRPGEGYRR